MGYTLQDLITYYRLPPEFIMMMNTDKQSSREKALNIIIEELLGAEDNSNVESEKVEAIKLLLSKVYDVGFYDAVAWTLTMMGDGFDAPLTEHEQKEE